MRDMGMVEFDEPFTRLLTQGMVLNHAYFRRNDKGGIDYVPPEDVDVERDETGRITGGKLEATARRSNTAASARCRSRSSTASIRRT